MMDFSLTTEQNELRKSVREFAEKEIRPIAGGLDENEAFSYDLTRAMGKLGLFGVFVSKDYGGQELDYLSYIIAVEELARIDASQAATIAAANSLGIGPIYYFGNEHQKKKYLPKLSTGEMLWAFALTEPDAGSDAGACQTHAIQDNDGWVINGSKTFITNASTDISGGVTVLASTGQKEDGRKELSCFLVESGTPGYTAQPMHRKMMWRASNTSTLYFEDCKVPKENLLGKQGKGFHQMLATLDRGRLSIGAMGLGGAQGCYEMALKYAKERNQFGRPISTFQANAFKLANMATEIRCARLLLYEACWLKCQNKRFTEEAAMAKLYCSEVMGRIANHAVQLHGSYGLMKDYDVERFYRDQKVLEIGEGTSEILRIIIARHIGAFPK